MVRSNFRNRVIWDQVPLQVLTTEFIGGKRQHVHGGSYMFRVALRRKVLIRWEKLMRRRICRSQQAGT